MIFEGDARLIRPRRPARTRTGQTTYKSIARTMIAAAVSVAT